MERPGFADVGSEFGARNGRAVLIIDDDLGTRETFDHALSIAGFAVSTAASGAEGLTLARAMRFDVTVVDLRLPDMLGIDVVRVLRQSAEMPFVLVSGFLTVDTAIQAMKLGAVDVIEKPVDIDDLVRTVESAVGPRPVGEEGAAFDSLGADDPDAARAAASVGTLAHGRSIAERWVTYVIKAREAADDFKTLQEWAVLAAVSYTTLCECCRLVNVRPHDARDLARVLRAVAKSGAHGWDPALFLDVSDRRTLKHMLDRAGVRSAGPPEQLSVEHVLDRQTFITASNPVIRLLRQKLTQ